MTTSVRENCFPPARMVFAGKLQTENPENVALARWPCTLWPHKRLDCLAQVEEAVSKDTKLQLLQYTHTKKTRLPQPCVCTTRLFPGCHNLVVTALQPGVPLTRLSQPCGDSLATWCSSYKVVTTLWGQPCNLVFLLQGCHNLVVTTYSRPEKLGWEVRLL